MLTATPFAGLSSQMTGRVVTPSDPDWDATRQVFNLAMDLRPAAVALPRNVDDVIAAVEYAGANGLRVAPQATATTPTRSGRSRTCSWSTSASSGASPSIPARGA
jgi:hypothetical protein